MKTDFEIEIEKCYLGCTIAFKDSHFEKWHIGKIVLLQKRIDPKKQSVIRVEVFEKKNIEIYFAIDIFEIVFLE